MERDKKADRAECIFKQVKPVLMKMFGNAPEYGVCGIDVTLHQGEVIRLLTRTEISRKLPSRTGGAW